MQKLYGLINSKQHPIPLLGVKVEGHFIGHGAKINIKQRFYNNECTAVEAIYKFPLPENSAVAGFKAWVGERMIQSTVEEREKAFEIYDRAMEQGYGAYLLDEERPNIFTLSVGNLNPGMEVIIEINLVMLLDIEGSAYRFTLPTTISPRYVPDDIPDNNGIPETNIIHPEYSESVPYGLSLLLKILNSERLVAIESPSHPIRVEMDGNCVQVELSSDSVKMDRDFILLINPGQTFISTSYRYDEGDYSYWQLDLFLPASKFPRVNTANEIIFLLDCSGSMQGQSIFEAKKALEICLKALPQNCKFNVYRFGSTYNSFFKFPCDYTEINLNDALKQLEKTDANLGGTEIYAPLEEIFSTSSTLSDRIIILLTDGEVGNEQQIFNLVTDNMRNLRLFTIGIGAGPNEHLIKGLARLRNGAYEFIYPGERIEPKVLRIFSRINIPKLDIKNISWSGKEIEQAPASPTIFADSLTTIFARSKSSLKKQSQIPLKVDIGTEVIECNFIFVKEAPVNIPIPVLWARERIRDLEDNIKLSGSQQWVRKEFKNESIIIALSKTYNILSRYTSFVGIEKRKEENRTQGEVQLRKVPALITTGWHGEKYFLPKIMPRYKKPCCFTIFNDEVYDKCESLSPEFFDTPPQKKNTKLDILSDLLLAQQLNGGFCLDNPLAKRLNLDLKKLKKLANQIIIKIRVDKFILLSTAIVLEVFRTLISEQKSVWQILANKSIIWINDILKQDQPFIDGKELTEWTKEFVKNEVKIKNN